MSLGSSELASSSTELGTIELAGLGSTSGPTDGSSAAFIDFTRFKGTRYVNTIYSRYSGIILDAPVFDDSIISQNRINFYKTMTRVAYTYVQTTNRVSLKYNYVIDRRKALELRNFIQSNIAQDLILTTWENKVYQGKFGTNPIELVSDRRYGHGNEAVTVSIEFLGVKISG